MNRKERRVAGKRGQAGASSGVGQFSTAAAFTQALRQYQAGDWLSAEATCRTILSHDAREADSLHLLGAMAHQGRRYDEAAACFRSLIAVKPNFVPAHHGLGSALAAAGRLEEAIAPFEQAVVLTPADAAPPAPAAADVLLALGNLYARLGRTEEAVKRFERAVQLRPDFAQAHNDCGAMLLAQGRVKEASAQFVKALQLAPELLEDTSAVLAMLLRLNPGLGDALARATAAWPARVPAQELFGPAGLAAVAEDALLRCVLESAPARFVELERLLTSMRAAVLKATAEGDGDESLLRLACALARQCFVNEYVFAVSDEEARQVEALSATLSDAMAKGGSVSPLLCAAVASYVPLSSLDGAQTLLSRSWPQPFEGVLTQQIREVDEERRLRDAIPRLTSIADGASTLVRQQYEENPYPRWVFPASSQSPLHREPVSVDQHLQELFPSAPFHPLGARDGVDIMIAGCGTGEHPIGMARRFKGARVLAVDLSLNSLCYAKRKTAELRLQNIEYAQADILQLGSLGRSFDVIDAGGVLHHMAEPAEGWRQLLALVRPGGFMRIGLYSELARADVVAARGFISERGFRPTVEDILRCRQELLTGPLRAVAEFRDFFTTSECRDLLFHVEEHRFNIPQLKQFLGEERLRFVGFETDAETANAYRVRFPSDRSMTDLDRWHVFETERSGTFRGMYKFWCQR
jgi:tetratricopeptide (TPR) repeat protein/2-polyprenyl-3-methyl-5-hydroxy-6-metoxy-1,4-benzoquinol methylase